MGYDKCRSLLVAHVSEVRGAARNGGGGRARASGGIIFTASPSSFLVSPAAAAVARGTHNHCVADIEKAQFAFGTKAAAVVGTLEGGNSQTMALTNGPGGGESGGRADATEEQEG